jgi:hypothetical protein
LTKLRVSELANEFGISAEELMGMLRTLDIVARTPASPLADDQVARARLRWEREKRTQKETSPRASRAWLTAPATCVSSVKSACSDTAFTPRWRAASACCSASALDRR